MNTFEVDVDIIHPFLELNRPGLIVESGSIVVLSNIREKRIEFPPKLVPEYLKMSFSDWLKYTVYLYN